MTRHTVRTLEGLKATLPSSAGDSEAVYVCQAGARLIIPSSSIIALTNGAPRTCDDRSGCRFPAHRGRALPVIELAEHRVQPANHLLQRAAEGILADICRAGG